jgi:hypothetical protein
MRANAGNFDNRDLWRKAAVARSRGQALCHRRGWNFTDQAATLAYQKCNGCARVVVMSAGEKRVAAFDAMDEAVGDQKIERAIYRDRGRARHRFGEFVDHFIGAERTMAGQQCLQHLTADRRQFLRPPATNLLGMFQRVRGAAAVIMVGRGKCRFCEPHQGQFSTLAGKPNPAGLLRRLRGAREAD